MVKLSDMLQVPRPSVFRWPVSEAVVSSLQVISAHLNAASCVEMRAQ